MMTQIIKQASATGVVAGSVATVRVPATGTIYAVYLRPLAAGGTNVSIANIKTAIGNMVLYHDGEQIMEMTATFALDLQKYYLDGRAPSGDANVAGVLPIYFAPPHFANFVERQLYAVGTQGIGVITLNLNILSTANMATIDVYTEITTEVRPRGQHIRIKKYAKNFGSTGDNEISDLPTEGDNVAYKALHIELGSGPGVIDHVTIKNGGFAFYDNVPVCINSAALILADRTPQADYFHVDFGRSNDITSYLPMLGVKDFRQVINWSGATAPDNFNIYAEEIFGLAAPAGAGKA